MILRSSTISLGEARGNPRIYLQGKWLNKAGFQTGKNITVDMHEGTLKITVDPKGDRTVSGKQNGTIPVVDINSKDLDKAFNGVQTLQVVAGENTITITPAHTAVLMSNRILAATEASMFSGGGILSMAAKICGFEPKVAIEINPLYADIYEANHPSATMFNMSASEVPYNDLSKFGPIGLFTAGIPCEPFSAIRRINRGTQEKRDSSLVPESHELGDMTFWALRGIEALNPHTVVIEEVPKFLASGAGQILQHVLRRLYRYVDARVISPLDYGALSGRERAVIVAQDQPIKWPATMPRTKTLGDILQAGDHEWFNRETKSWLFNHWDNQTAKGNGFASQVYDASSTHIGTIKKRYFAQQGDNPVIKHPTLPDTFRWLTLDEVKRLHGIPQDYYLGESKTTAGEVMGQAVVLNPFIEIIREVTRV